MLNQKITFYFLTRKYKNKSSFKISINTIIVFYLIIQSIDHYNDNVLSQDH